MSVKTSEVMVMVTEECRFKASGIEVLVSNLEGFAEVSGMVDRARNYPDWGSLEVLAFNIRANTEMQQKFHPITKKWVDFAKQLEQKVKEAKPKGDFQYYIHEGLSFIGKDMESKFNKMKAEIWDHWIDMIIECECEK